MLHLPHAYYTDNSTIYGSVFKDDLHIAFLKSTLAAAAVKLLQLCPTLCNTIDGSPPGSPVPELLQARTLEWVAISFSNAWKWRVKVKSLSRVWLLATPWTAAHPLLGPWDFPGKSTGVGCHCLLRRHKSRHFKTSNSAIFFFPWAVACYSIRSFPDICT